VQFLLRDTSLFINGPTPAFVSLHGWYDDEWRWASFWNKAEVGVDLLNFNWASWDVVTSAVAHEIGHLYGLHDRYYTWQPEQGVPDPLIQSICNPDEETIMDTAIWWQDPQTLLWWITGHCDGLFGPAEQDVGNVSSYWREGEVDDLEAEVWGSPSILTIRFRDRGWTECHAFLQYFYLDGDEWICYENLCWSPDMGLHEDYPDGMGDWTMLRNNFPENFGAANAWNCCMGAVYFKQWDLAGPWSYIMAYVP